MSKTVMTEKKIIPINLLLIGLDGAARTTRTGQICPTYPKDQELRKATADLCELLKIKGWTIAAVTNQGGCEAINPNTSKPYKTRRQAVAECKYFLDMASWCDRVYMCPNNKGSSKDEVYRVTRSRWPWPKYWVLHDHNDDHPYYQTVGYRKPNPGMLDLAIRDQEQEEWSQAREFGARERDMLKFEIRALMVGDMDRDRFAAKNAGVPYLSAEEFERIGTPKNLSAMLAQHG